MLMRQIICLFLLIGLLHTGHTQSVRDSLYQFGDGFTCFTGISAADDQLLLSGTVYDTTARKWGALLKFLFNLRCA